MPRLTQKTISFLTGTRAEFGLMRTTLDAIKNHPALKLQLIVTGMHLDPRHGDLDFDRPINATISWPANSGRSPAVNAANTGQAISHLARAFTKLKSDIILIVGDRVEAFAAASAAHISRRLVAHIHGGDRALGQVDDSLRHAITKLAHLHFPATRESARRLLRLGEDPWRIHRVGSPGLDNILALAQPDILEHPPFHALSPRSFALLLLHPIDADATLEARRAQTTLAALRAAGVDQIVLIYPNNDPGSAGILRAWDRASGKDLIKVRNLPREAFLGLMRHAAFLIGNSSSGIIEAASFGLPVIDIGPRQLGRQRSANVLHCDYDAPSLRRAIDPIWNHGSPRRSRAGNVYGAGGAGQRIAEVLATIGPPERLLTKIISY